MAETNENAFVGREEGYIKLYRTITDSCVFAHPEKLKVWIWCLLKASFKSRHISLNVGNGTSTISLKPGEFVFGRNTAADELCMPGSTIYKIMKQFEDEGMIKIRSSSKYSIITICKWKTYQHDTPLNVAAEEQQDSSEVTIIEQQDSNKGAARELQENTNKKDKKVNNDKKKGRGEAPPKNDLEFRQEEFKNAIAQYTEYDETMRSKFYNYWSEPNRSRTKMKCDMERTWDLSRRLTAWRNRDLEYKNRTNGHVAKKSKLNVNEGWNR